jgi:hypothetical protein
MNKQFPERLSALKATADALAKTLSIGTTIKGRDGRFSSNRLSEYIQLSPRPRRPACEDPFCQRSDPAETGIARGKALSKLAHGLHIDASKSA